MKILRFLRKSKTYWIATFSVPKAGGGAIFLRRIEESKDDTFPYTRAIKAIVGKYHYIPAFLGAVKISKEDYLGYFSLMEEMKEKMTTQQELQK